MGYLDCIIVWFTIFGCSNAYSNEWCQSHFGYRSAGDEYAATSSGFRCTAWPPDSDCRASGACCATCFSTRCFYIGSFGSSSSGYTCSVPTPPPTPSPIPFDIDVSRAIECDLASVDYGDSLSCALDVTVHDDQPDGADAGTVTILNQFNFSDSSGNESYCYNPTISLSYVDNDFDEADEYLTVGFFGGVVATCGNSAACESKSCLSNYPLPYPYVDESVELEVTIFVSAAVEGVDSTNNEICSGGNVFEGNLTIGCTRTNTHAPTLSPITKRPTTSTTTTTTLPTTTTIATASDVRSGASLVSLMTVYGLLISVISALFNM